MIGWSSRREFPFSRFIENFSIFGILRGEFQFHFFDGLG